MNWLALPWLLFVVFFVATLIVARARRGRR